jgi:hypothetical protein
MDNPLFLPLPDHHKPLGFCPTGKPWKRRASHITCLATDVYAFLLFSHFFQVALVVDFTRQLAGWAEATEDFPCSALQERVNRTLVGNPAGTACRRVPREIPKGPAY